MSKTVLITGASGGIGSAAAKAFSRPGYRVVLHFFSGGERIQALESELRQQTGFFSVCADLTSEQEVRHMFEETESRFGPVDILINNAGIAQQKLFTDITTAEWKHMFDVHVNGAFYCCRNVIPSMVRQKKGKIINISSIWGITGASCEVHYSAAKAALIGMTKALAKELGPSNIQVNCVAPGVINTPMNQDISENAVQALREEIPLGRFGAAEEVANIILFLTSGQSDYITGQVISPNGGLVI